jgi:hypothetical protein
VALVAQFVHLGGGPPAGTDEEMRTAVAARQDAAVAELRESLKDTDDRVEAAYGNGFARGLAAGASVFCVLCETAPPIRSDADGVWTHRNGAECRAGRVWEAWIKVGLTPVHLQEGVPGGVG